MDAFLSRAKKKASELFVAKTETWERSSEVKKYISPYFNTVTLKGLHLTGPWYFPDQVFGSQVTEKQHQITTVFSFLKTKHT